MSAYLDQSGEPSSEPGRFVRFDDLEPLTLVEGMDFRPVTTDTVMANHATIAPNTDLAIHHHAEQQILLMIAGELNFRRRRDAAAARRRLRGDPAARPPRRRRGP